MSPDLIHFSSMHSYVGYIIYNIFYYYIILLELKKGILKGKKEILNLDLAV